MKEYYKGNMMEKLEILYNRGNHIRQVQAHNSSANQITRVIPIFPSPNANSYESLTSDTLTLAYELL